MRFPYRPGSPCCGVHSIGITGALELYVPEQGPHNATHQLHASKIDYLGARISQIREAQTLHVASFIVYL